MMLFWATLRPRIMTSPRLLEKIFEAITRGSVEGVWLTVKVLIWIEMSVDTSNLTTLTLFPVNVRIPDVPSTSTTEVSKFEMTLTWLACLVSMKNLWQLTKLGPLQFTQPVRQGTQLRDVRS